MEERQESSTRRHSDMFSSSNVGGKYGKKDEDEENDDDESILATAPFWLSSPLLLNTSWGQCDKSRCLMGQRCSWTESASVPMLLSASKQIPASLTQCLSEREVKQEWLGMIGSTRALHELRMSVWRWGDERIRLSDSSFSDQLLDKSIVLNTGGICGLASRTAPVRIRVLLPLNSLEDEDDEEDEEKETVFSELSSSSTLNVFCSFIWSW